MKNNKQFKLMSFREKQHKMYKILITMIIVILSFGFLNAGCSMVILAFSHDSILIIIGAFFKKS